MSDDWEQPASPPPPLFLGEKERDIVKQIGDELIERVIGQTILYYPLSIEHTNFHSVYGEAVEKVFADPVKVNVLVEWEGFQTTSNNLGVDRIPSIVVHFHKRRLMEDQDLYVSEGDFLVYGDSFYELVTINEPKQLFGQISHRVEITAKCVKARKGLFDNG